MVNAQRLKFKVKKHSLPLEILGWHRIYSREMQTEITNIFCYLLNGTQFKPNGEQLREMRSSKVACIVNELRREIKSVDILRVPS